MIDYKKVYEDLKPVIVKEMVHDTVESEYMPKVGEWCECTYPIMWTKVFVIGIDKSDETVIQLKSGEIMSVGELAKFRPIKSDREVFIERVVNLAEGHDGSLFTADLARILHENGARFADE